MTTTTQDKALRLMDDANLGAICIENQWVYPADIRRDDALAAKVVGTLEPWAALAKRVEVLLQIVPVVAGSATIHRAGDGGWEVWGRVPNRDGVGAKSGRIWQAASPAEAVSVRNLLNFRR